jgi:hypothetical protein
MPATVTFVGHFWATDVTAWLASGETEWSHLALALGCCSIPDA